MKRMNLAQSLLGAILTLAALAGPSVALAETNPGSQPLFTETKAEINLLSLNVWGLPAPIGTALVPRMERIAKAVRGYDVVVLQETFDSSSDDIIAKSGYPYGIQEQNPGWGQVRSGLTTLSRWPIIKSGFYPFAHCYSTDCLARKGILFTRILHPELGPIDVYNTHYQSMRRPEAAEVRLTQNIAMQRFVFANNGYYPTILGGDFNLSPDSGEYKDLTTRLPLLDSFGVKHPDHVGFSMHVGPQGFKPSNSQRIDYLFLLQNARYSAEVLASALEFTEPVEGLKLSDHLGVSARLRISGPVNR